MKKAEIGVWPIYGRYFLGVCETNLLHVVIGTREDAFNKLPEIRERDPQLSLTVGERSLDFSTGAGIKIG